MGNQGSYIRTLKSRQEILKSEFASDEAWIKIKSVPELKNGETPDDSPLPENIYIGPFSIYDFDL